MSSEQRVLVNFWVVVWTQFRKETQFPFIGKVHLSITNQKSNLKQSILILIHILCQKFNSVSLLKTL